MQNWRRLRKLTRITQPLQILFSSTSKGIRCRISVQLIFLNPFCDMSRKGNTEQKKNWESGFIQMRVAINFRLGVIFSNISDKMRYFYGFVLYNCFLSYLRGPNYFFILSKP